LEKTQHYQRYTRLCFGFLSEWTNGGQHNKIHINLKLMHTI
jgi:hypothetical protein